MPEAVLFAITEIKVRDKKAGRASTVTFENSNVSGVSKIVLTGSEEDAKLYRVGEFYEMTLKQVQAPAE